MVTNRVHTCSKETEIALIKQDLDASKKLLVEIHHSILGNGKPGIRRELDELKILREHSDELVSEQGRILSDLRKRFYKYAGAISVIVFFISLLSSVLVKVWWGV